MAQKFELELKKLKEKEKEELALLKEKRIKQEEMIKKENDKKEKEKILTALKKNKETLTTDLEKIKKKSFALQIENDSWEEVRKKTLKDLKENEKLLNEQLEKIWEGRDFFCDETEKYIEEYGFSSKWWKEKMNIVNDPQLLKRRHLKKKQCKVDNETNEKIIFNLKKEIKELKEKIEEEKAKKDNNDILMKELETEKEYLLQETNVGEFKRIKENLELLNKRCSELVKFIGQKENSRKLTKPSELNFEAGDWPSNAFDLDNERKEPNGHGENITHVVHPAEPETQNRSFRFYGVEANKKRNDPIFEQEKNSEEPNFEAEDWFLKTSDLKGNSGRKGKLDDLTEKVISFVRPMEPFDTESRFLKGPANIQEKEEKTSEGPSKRKKFDVNTLGADKGEPDSFLFQMLDPATVKAAKAKAKTRRLSTMRVQDRNRHLQISFNNFLSQIRD